MKASCPSVSALLLVALTSIILSAAAAPAPAYKHTMHFLQSNKQFSMLYQIVQASPTMRAKLESPTFTATTFAPDNIAITKFLKKHKMTLKQLIAHPNVGAQILSYHVVPKVKVTRNGMKRSRPSILPTLHPGVNQMVTYNKDKSVTILPVYSGPSLPTCEGARKAKVDWKAVGAKIKNVAVTVGTAIVHVVDTVAEACDNVPGICSDIADAAMAA